MVVLSCRILLNHQNIKGTRLWEGTGQMSSVTERSVFYFLKTWENDASSPIITSCIIYPRISPTLNSWRFPRSPPPLGMERNNSTGKNRRIALDVKMDGRRFDVGVSDPFLEIFLRKWLNKKIGFWSQLKWITGITGKFIEIAVNRFHHRRSCDRIKSIQGVANQFEITARGWQSVYGQHCWSIRSHWSKFKIGCCCGAFVFLL